MERIVAVTDDLDAHGAVLLAAEAVHRVLRPVIPSPYADYMRRMFAEGAEMAVLQQDDAVRAIGVYRQHHTTYSGLRLYVDDLVTDPAHRSRGHGGQLLDWLEARARARGCAVLALDSGVQRDRAHAFYFRQKLVIWSFSFRRMLADGAAP